MKSIKTSIRIDASPQTVWSVLDNLQQYPEWNNLTSALSGRTTVGSVVRGTMTRPGVPAVPIGPTINAIVGAREFRWLTDVPGFRAEHYFLLRPTTDGGTDLTHVEDFDGSALAERWVGIEASSPLAFDQMNRDLKTRAEQFKSAVVNLHPAVDNPIERPAKAGMAATLTCLCPTDQVEVKVVRPIYHNHLCGCSKCWRAKGVLFAQLSFRATDWRSSPIRKSSTSSIRHNRSTDTHVRNAEHISMAMFQILVTISMVFALFILSLRPADLPDPRNSLALSVRL